jgi:hypothetical protein
MAFDFAALNAVRHHRNRQEPHTGPAASPAAGSGAAKSAIVHRVIHKGVGMFVAATAGAIDAGGFWAGGMPEIGSKGSGVGLDILAGVGGSVFELFSLWRGMKLGYIAPVVSGATDGFLFYWAGKQGQLFGASKRRTAGTAKGETWGPGVSGETGTGFDYALPDGRRRPAAPAATNGVFAYDPMNGFT